MTLNLALNLLAFVALGIAAFNVSLVPNRIAWGWLGLFLLTLSLIFGGLKL
jgi:hypothetical protein